MATFQGGFIHTLSEHFIDSALYVGIDVEIRAMLTAKQVGSSDQTTFVCSDAARICFDENTFDTVSLSASLHHLKHPSLVLEEMMRVLRKGGNMIIAALTSCGKSKAQMNLIHLHHLYADIDLVKGIVHFHTYPRSRILDYAEQLGLAKMDVFDSSLPMTDPMDEVVIEKFIQLTEKKLGEVAACDDIDGFREKWHLLEKNILAHGIQDEPSILIVGQK